MNRFTRNIKRLFDGLRIDLFVVLIFSITFILLFDFIFLGIPEIFQDANKIGVFFYNLCFAYVAAYIFYFLNVFIRQQKEKREINHYVARKVLQILLVVFTVIQELEKASEIKINDKFPNKKELDLITKKLKINGLTSLKSIVGSYATWAEYLDYHKRRTEGYINKILIRMVYTDYKIIGLLSRIEDSRHFLDIEYIGVWKKSPDNLSFMSSSLNEYFKLHKELEELYNKKLKMYL